MDLYKVGWVILYIIATIVFVIPAVVAVGRALKERRVNLFLKQMKIDKKAYNEFLKWRDDEFQERLLAIRKDVHKSIAIKQSDLEGGATSGAEVREQQAMKGAL